VGDTEVSNPVPGNKTFHGGKNVLKFCPQWLRSCFLELLWRSFFGIIHKGKGKCVGVIRVQVRSCFVRQIECNKTEFCALGKALADLWACYSNKLEAIKRVSRRGPFFSTGSKVIFSNRVNCPEQDLI
jgi:hypothetical protein